MEDTHTVTILSSLIEKHATSLSPLNYTEMDRKITQATTDNITFVDVKCAFTATSAKLNGLYIAIGNIVVL